MTSPASLVKSMQSLGRSSFSDDNERILVLRAAQALCNRLETPYESVMRMTYQEVTTLLHTAGVHKVLTSSTQPPYKFALQLGSQISLFKYLSSKDEPQSTQELAAMTSAEPEFLKRILRHLAAKGTITQQGPDAWTATDLSQALADSSGPANVNAVSSSEPIWDKALEFFEARGLKSPTNGRDTVYQSAHNCPGLGMFEHLKRPENAQQWSDFNTRIAWNSQWRVSWMDVFPPDAMFADAKVDRAAFVDIGGGTGADVIETRRRFPAAILPSKVVLQEVAQVIEATQKKKSGHDGTASPVQEVELQVYDFWTPQPIRGARIYYMSSILHDWPDDKAELILQNVVSAMERGYSRLILNENVLPEVGCFPMQSGLDLVMMANLAGKERTETDWKKLLDRSGLRMVKVHTIPACTKNVIEAELSEEPSHM